MADASKTQLLPQYPVPPGVGQEFYHEAVDRHLPKVSIMPYKATLRSQLRVLQAGI